MIKLIVGLGNPGQKYADTRHNAGVWYLQELAYKYNCTLRAETKFQSQVGQTLIENRDIRLVFPTTYMNLSGQAVVSVADYFKIEPQNILVLHDELDLNPGTVRLKKAGGHGGHNGLRDIIQHIGKDFYRLRIGIGHPGNSSDVSNFVLKAASSKEQKQIEDAIENSLQFIPQIIKGEFQNAMNRLNQKPKEKKQKPTAEN